MARVSAVLAVLLVAILLLLSVSYAYAAVGASSSSGGGSSGGGSSSSSSGSGGGSGSPNQDKITNQECNSSAQCTPGFECFSFQGVGARCAKPGPCSYHCRQGTVCNITESDPPQVECREIVPSVKSAFKCSELQTKKARLKCRINLPEENEYDYLPEECRALSGASRGNCTSNYQKVQKCWQFDRDERRFECARNEFALKNIANERAECEALGTNKSSCMRQLREKVDAYIKFRIYNLEEKAGRLKNKGVSEARVVDLVAALEDKKLAYNAADTKDEKKKVLKEVKELWRVFVEEAKMQIKQQREMDKEAKRSGNETKG
ncbi:hypothetical protein HYV82_03330 [Candidatus Woesearchaeota archaeon]|nr:hypothetical protein [Candidatus Woesearchaeota archaeon]